MSARRSRGARRLAVAAFLAVAAVLSVRAWIHLDASDAVGGVQWAMGDFRDAVYYPAVALLEGRNPYDTAGFRRYPIEKAFPLYLPASPALHVGFGLLPYRASQACYFVLTLALTVLLARSALGLAGARVTMASVWAFAALLLASRPGHVNLLLGQVTAQVVLATYVALRHARERSWLAAAALAVALCKPTTGVPLALLLLFGWGDLRAVVAGGAAAGIVSLAAIARMAHEQGLAAFVASLGGSYGDFQSDGMVNAATSLTRVDAAAVLARVAGHAVAGGIELGLLLGVVGLGTFGVRRALARGGASGQRTAVGLACLTILVCAYHQAYEVLLVAVPVASLAAGTGPRALRWPLLALIALPLVNYAGTWTTIRWLDLGPTGTALATVVNGLALLAAWGGYLWAAVRGGDA